MLIAVCRIDYHLEGCGSLKEKRMFLNRLKGRLRSRFNVAVAEVEHQDLWQRAGIAVAAVASDRRVLEAVFEKVIEEAERHDGQMIRCEVEYR